MLVKIFNNGELIGEFEAVFTEGYGIALHYPDGGFIRVVDSKNNVIYTALGRVRDHMGLDKRERIFLQLPTPRTAKRTVSIGEFIN